ncbi:MAG: cell division protein FtsZ, partial [Bacteroidota bacterium]|nr:cell division protein FtsZ [Bacteroidota bacterium]
MSSNNDFGIHFDLPKNQSNVIKVIGVGGGGSNAINHMFKQGIKGVDFVICNTDSQALNNSGVPNKIQLGINLTEGLGAGANPDIGEKAAVESLEDIRTMLTTNTKMVFITAGMGGGTGTGAAPIIAKMAMDMDILTVGIVTMPFQFEGKIRNVQAHEGIAKFRKVVDSLVIINNNKLREVYGNLGFKAGFSKADEVLSTAARGIAEVITHHYTQNIDLRDAKTVLSSSGTAIMGASTAFGENRAKKAIGKALDSPLLNDNKITGAKNVLLLIVSGSQEITIDEIGEINDHIQAEAGHVANIIMGVGEDATLGEAISVTIIATGFDANQQNDISNVEPKKVVHALEDEQTMEHDLLLSDTDGADNKAFEPAETIVCDLVEDPMEFTLEDSEQTMDLIPTSELLKDIEVNFEELLQNIDDEEFIINNVAAVEDVSEGSEGPSVDDQTCLT